MNKFQKETERVLLEHEKELFNQLKDSYAQALAEVKRMIRELQVDIDILEKSNLENESIIRSKIYRLNYQKALKEQLSATMELLNSKNVSNIQSFLTKMYEDSFLSINYHLQKFGIPVINPINHKLIVDIINTKTEDMKFSDRLYSNMQELKKTVKSEISRGLANGKSYNQIAKQISNRTEADFYKSYRIARTEGGRVSSNAKFQSMLEAKKKGADIVKQWEAVLDDKTRGEHAELDQQIRELEEPFELGDMKAMYPGDFGIAHMDINCRCTMLSVPRWDIQKKNMRIDNMTGETIVCENYFDWKEKYYKKVEEMKE